MMKMLMSVRATLIMYSVYRNRKNKKKLILSLERVYLCMNRNSMKKLKLHLGIAIFWENA
jgi:hypothetical protein